MNKIIYLIFLFILLSIFYGCVNTSLKAKTSFIDTIYSVSIYGCGSKEPQPLENGSYQFSSDEIKTFQKLLKTARSSKHYFSIPGYRDLFAEMKTQKGMAKFRISRSILIDLTNRREYEILNKEDLEWISNLMDSLAH